MATLNEQIQQIQTARDNMKLALEGKGMSPSKDIRTYAEAINNLSGAKLFETVEEMQADETAQEGDLAVVYKQEILPVTEESEFSSCIFPNTVVLDEAFTGSIYSSFRSTGSSYFDGSVNLSSSSFRFNGYGDSSEIRVQYESQDGITYTRTDGGDELQEFGTAIKWESSGNPFNDIIGNFMKINGSTFDGLYQYKAFNNKNKIHVYSYSELTWNSSTRKLIGTGGEVIEFNIEATLNKITEYIETNFSDYRTGTYYGNPIYEYMIYYDNNCIVFPFATQNDGSPKFLYNLYLLVDNTTWKATGGIIRTYSPVKYSLHEVRVNITTGQLSYELLEENFTNETYQPLARFNNYKFVGNIDRDGVFNNKYQSSISAILYYSTENSTWYVSNGIYGEESGVADIKYLLADTQFNLKSSNELLPNKIALGKNGVVIGDKTVYNNLDLLEMFQTLTGEENFLITNEINKPDDREQRIYYIEKCTNYMDNALIIKQSKFDNYVDACDYILNKLNLESTINKYNNSFVHLCEDFDYDEETGAETKIDYYFMTYDLDSSTHTKKGILFKTIADDNLEFDNIELISSKTDIPFPSTSYDSAIATYVKSESVGGKVVMFHICNSGLIKVLVDVTEGTFSEEILNLSIWEDSGYTYNRKYYLWARPNELYEYDFSTDQLTLVHSHPIQCAGSSNRCQTYGLISVRDMSDSGSKISIGTVLFVGVHGSTQVNGSYPREYGFYYIDRTSGEVTYHTIYSFTSSSSYQNYPIMQKEWNIWRLDDDRMGIYLVVYDGSISTTKVFKIHPTSFEVTDVTENYTFESQSTTAMDEDYAMFSYYEETEEDSVAYNFNIGSNLIFNLSNNTFYHKTFNNMEAFNFHKASGQTEIIEASDEWQIVRTAFEKYYVLSNYTLAEKKHNDSIGMGFYYAVDRYTQNTYLLSFNLPKTDSV